MSHWNGDRGLEEQRRKDDTQRGMKKKFREKVHTKSRGRHELHEHKHEETFEQGSLVVISVSLFHVTWTFPIFSAMRRNNLYSEHNLCKQTCN